MDAGGGAPLLSHCSIGTVYCWSTFKEAIAQHIVTSTFNAGWVFGRLAIFFLGMSAAFAGLAGNNMSELILARTGHTYDYVLFATQALYVVAMVICLAMVSGKKTAKQSA